MSLIKQYNYITVIMTVFLNFIFTLFLIGIMEMGLKGYVYTNIVASSIEAGVMFAVLKKEKILSFRFDIGRFREMLSFGTRGLFASVSGEIFDKLDRLIIGLFLTIDQVGIYQIALNLSNKLRLIHQSLGLTLYPKIAGMSIADAALLTNRLLNMIFWPLLIIVLLLILITPAFIPLFFGERFLPAYYPFVFLAIGVLFDSLNKIVGYFFLGTGRPGIWSIQKFLYLIINAVALYLTVPALGITGAGIAGLASSVLPFVYVYTYYKKSRNISNKRIFYFDLNALRELLRGAKKTKGHYEKSCRDNM